MKTALTMIALLALSSGAMAESNYIQRMAQAHQTVTSTASQDASQANHAQ